MIALCVESSHTKGMGHLYRGLVLADYFAAKGARCVFILNDDPVAKSIVSQAGYCIATASFNDPTYNWEEAIIHEYRITVWINDRLATNAEHAARIKQKNILLVTLDDFGDGAELSDLHFCGIPCVFQGRVLKGHKVLSGLRYLVLNPDLMKCRRLRSSVTSTIVSLGGSDTHGATVAVVNKLAELGVAATIITGPSFAHQAELALSVKGTSMNIKQSVPSLVEEFMQHDLAITCGGMTAFEANASGLPCLIIANEDHEVINARFLESIGSSRYLGGWNDFSLDTVLGTLDIAAMSNAGLNQVACDGVKEIHREIVAQCQKL